MPQLDLAILYWFYKEPEVTKNHLELLRKHNPNYKIYGLFGGDPSQAEVFEKQLGEQLDDFWTYPGTYGIDAYEKWIHGDLLLLDWYDKHGKNLDWDSVAVTQWDMLVFDDILKRFPGLKQGQVFFSGFRELDVAVENRWKWTRPDGNHRVDYESFVEFISQEYGYKNKPKICLYLFEILTREFFNKYLQLPDKKIGMLEYKDPTLAYIFGLDIYDRDIGVCWQDWRQPNESPLIALGNYMVEKEFINSELSEPDGWRIFHPYEKLW